MVVSGRHMEKETPAKGDAPAKLKRDASGKPIVIANVLEVVDVASGRSVVAFKPPVLFDNLALSPNNQFLAAETSQQAGVVNVLHLASRKSKQLKTGLRRIPPGGIVFSGDSRSINVVLPDRLLTIALASGETKEFKFEIASPAVSYSPATNMVAVGVSRSRHGRPEIQVYDVAQGKPTEELAVPSGPSRVEFSSDGRYLAATIAGGVVRLWQTNDWTSVGSVAGQFAFDPGQLAVSTDGQLVAVRPRGAGGQEMKVINITGGDTVQSIRTREMFFLPSGLLAVADVTGPFYLNTSSGSVTELPGGDAALAQAGAMQTTDGDTSTQPGDASPAVQTGYGQVPAPQQNTQAGYGQVSSGQDNALAPEYASRYGPSAQQATSGQAGYGQTSTSQPNNGQPGYGQTSTSQPPSDQPGYGQTSTSQPSSDQPGYGQTSTSQPSDQPGYGQTSASQSSSGQAGYGQTSTSQTASDQAGYGQTATSQRPSDQSGSPSGVRKPFLDQKKPVGPRSEWPREITSRAGGAIAFRVASSGPFAVAVVTDRAYRALGNRDRKSLRKEDVLFAVDSKGPTHEAKLTLPPGSCWFIIENQTDGEVEFHLQCFDARNDPPQAVATPPDRQ
jgi:hypothetical protein